MTTLYDITGQYKGLMHIADDLPEDALQDTLESITDELEVKAQNIVYVLKNMNTLAIDDEIKRLQAMKKSVVNRKASLTDYLRSNMEACDINKITWDTGSITLRKPTQAVQVSVEAHELPEAYQRKTIAADKAGIKAALKSGIEIHGCSMVDGQRGLLIK